MGIRTDLAMEAKALWEKSAGKTTKLAGVRARERERDGFAVTDVHILDRRGRACSWPGSETKPSRRMPSGRCACAGCS